VATAVHRTIDAVFRIESARLIAGLARVVRDVGLAEDLAQEALDDDVGDDLLRLMFTACHPVLSTEARVALTLRLAGG
jgi:predicted RNA polymerase sigma factor